MPRLQRLGCGPLKGHDSANSSETARHSTVQSPQPTATLATSVRRPCHQEPRAGGSGPQGPRSPRSGQPEASSRDGREGPAALVRRAPEQEGKGLGLLVGDRGVTRQG